MRVGGGRGDGICCFTLYGNLGESVGSLAFDGRAADLQDRIMLRNEVDLIISEDGCKKDFPKVEMPT